MFDKTDSCTLNIFSTTKPTEHRIPTLMHDHIYRMSVAWQNVGYNQPPHLGYYLPDYKTKGIDTGISELRKTDNNDTLLFDLSGRHVSNTRGKGIYIIRNGSETTKLLRR